MTKEQILDLIARVDHPQLDYTTAGLIQHYSELLARISGRATQQEMSELVAVGVGFYQMGFEDFKASIGTEELFKSLAERQKREGH